LVRRLLARRRCLVKPKILPPNSIAIAGGGAGGKTRNARHRPLPSIAEKSGRKRNRRQGRTEAMPAIRFHLLKMRCPQNWIEQWVEVHQTGWQVQN